MSRILTPLAANSIVFAQGAVWVASAESGRVVKIDPSIDKIIATTPLHATISDLAVGNGSVWVSIVPDNVVYRLNPDDGSVLATMSAGPWPAALSAGDGLWVADAKGRQISRLDGAGGRDVVALSGPPRITRLSRRPAVDIRGRARAAPSRRDGPDAEDPAGRRGPIGNADPASSVPGRQPARLRDLRVPPELPGRSGGPRAGSSGPRSRPRCPTSLPTAGPTRSASAPAPVLAALGQAVTAETFRPPSSARCRRSSPRRRGEFARPSCSPTSSVPRRTRPGGRRTSRVSRRRRHADDPADAPGGRPRRAASHVVLLSGARWTPACRAAASRRRSHGGPLPRRLDGGDQVVLERNPTTPATARAGSSASSTPTVHGGRRDLARRARERRLRHGSTSPFDTPGRSRRGGPLDTRVRPLRAAPGVQARAVCAEPGPRVRRDRVQHAAAALPRRPHATCRRVRARSARARCRLRRAAHRPSRPPSHQRPGRQHRLSRRTRPRHGAPARRPGRGRNATLYGSGPQPTSASRRSSVRTSPRSASTCTSTGRSDASPAPSRNSWLRPTCNSCRTGTTFSTPRRSSSCRSATPTPPLGTGGTLACEHRSSAPVRRAARRASRPMRASEKTLVRDEVPVTVYAQFRQPRVLLGARRLQALAGRTQVADLGALCLRS